MRVISRHAVCGLIALLCCLTASASADRITLKNSGSLEGIIIAETETVVTIQTANASLTISRDDIAAIELESETVNCFHWLTVEVHRHRIREVVSRLRQLREADFDVHRLIAFGEESERSLERMLSLAELSPRRQLLGELIALADMLTADSLAAANRDPEAHEFRLLIVRQCRQVREFNRSFTQLSLIPAAYFHERQALCEQAIGWLIEDVQRETLVREWTSAHAAWQLIKRLEPDRECAAQALVLLRQTADQCARQEWELALTAYQFELAPLFPAIAANRTSHTLRLATANLKDRQGARAVLLWKNFGLELPPAEVVPVLVDLHLAAGRQALDAEKFMDAQRHFTAAESYRTDAARQELHLLRYAQENQRLAEEDFPAREALTMQCVACRLYPQARRLCTELRAHYLSIENHEQARRMEQQLIELNEQEAQELLDKAQGEYGAQRYFRVLDHLGEIRERFLQFSKIQTAREIEQLTQREIAKALPNFSSIEELLDSNWRTAARRAQQGLQNASGGSEEQAALADLLAIAGETEEEERKIPRWLRAHQLELLMSEAQREWREQNFKQARALLYGVLATFGELSVKERTLPLIDELSTLILCRELETGQTAGRWRELDAPKNAALRAELKLIFDELF